MLASQGDRVGVGRWRTAAGGGLRLCGVRRRRLGPPGTGERGGRQGDCGSGLCCRAARRGVEPEPEPEPDAAGGSFGPTRSGSQDGAGEI